MLISEERLKKDSLINNNVDTMYIYPAIQTAQEIGLQSIIGTRLYEKILEIVRTGAEGYDNYYDLLDNYIIPYLEMKVMSDIQMPLMYKIRNEGIVQQASEYTTLPSMKDAQYMVDFYDNKAKFYANRMSDYLCANRSKFPEYCQHDCSELPADRMGYKTNIYLG